MLLVSERTSRLPACFFVCCSRNRQLSQTQHKQKHKSPVFILTYPIGMIYVLYCAHSLIDSCTVVRLPVSAFLSNLVAVLPIYITNVMWYEVFYYLFLGDVCGITAAPYRACNNILAYDSQLLFYIAVRFYLFIYCTGPSMQCFGVLDCVTYQK